MKIYTLALMTSFVLVFSLSHAQVSLKYDTTLLKQVAQEACTCLDNLNVSDLAPYDDPLRTEETRNCLIDKLLAYKEELELADVGDTPDEMTKKRIESVVLIRLTPFLMRDCQKFFDVMLVKYQERRLEEKKWEEENAEGENYDYEQYEDSTEYAMEEEVTEGAEYVFEGKLIGLEKQNPYTFLLIENQAGESRKFLWLHSFMGEEKLRESFESYKGGQIKVEFYETQVINPNTLEYEYYQELSYIELPGK